MAINETRRLRPDEIDADRITVIALQALRDYDPRGAHLSAEALRQLLDKREKAQQDEIIVNNAAAAQRDATVAAEWALHNAAVAARVQVRAQFGDDSDAVQAVGLKKRSDRKRPVQRKRDEQDT